MSYHENFFCDHANEVPAGVCPCGTGCYCRGLTCKEITVNVHGNSGDDTRGTWCTPERIANMLPKYYLDPCSNPRSHIRAEERWSLEQDINGLLPAWVTALTARQYLTLRTFINPPYSKGQVLRWVKAYRHTDFTFLLRWDPSTVWFRELMPFVRYVWFPLGWRINFEPPPGVKASSSTMPHALYFKSEPPSTLKDGMILPMPLVL